MTSGEVASERDTYVYINCPFTKDYEVYFDAIVLTILYCGFVPRSALENDSPSVPRMERIREALLGSRYSVHDVSRIYADTRTGVARMNMPLELGMAIGVGFSQQKSSVSLEAHEWTAHILPDPKHKDAISDLNAYDIPRYSNREQLVVRVMKWLRERPNCPRPSLHPGDFWPLLDEYDKGLHGLRQHWHDQPPWSEMIVLGKKLVAKYLRARRAR